jgi:polyisoprenyl-phosphate glycosyltransferase
MEQVLPAAFSSLPDRIRHLHGPILVLGSSGFVGANIMRAMLQFRGDVYGTATRTPAWRLEDILAKSVHTVDLLIDSNLDALLNTIQPRTIFNCVAYGGYSFEVESQLIYRTNFHFVTRLLKRLESHPIACYVHAGSSSEYGDNASGPCEEALLAPNSDYAVSKVAASSLIYFYGKRKHLPCANLRLYSIYGPLEDASRLIPSVIQCGIEGRYPEFVSSSISRDFVYIDDVIEAFVDTALRLTPEGYGESINIGSGQKTTISELARLCQELFNIAEEPSFTMPSRSWDVSDWYANIEKARRIICWEPRTSLVDGLTQTIAWYRNLPDKAKYQRSSKKFGLDTVYSISAIVACYNDAAAIPLIYERLKATFTKMNIDFEIVFVNDCSMDNSEEIIRTISGNDRRVVGISHSRSFGAQAAFRSGMEVASKNACVLLNGNLEDPPEVIEQFVAQWRNGSDVVYGQRIKSHSKLVRRISTRAFYWIFNYFSSIRIPANSGDFSLIDRRVVAAMLQFPERDLFLRGLRVFAGFKQVGVYYNRASGVDTHRSESWLRGIRRAKYGILSFSSVPLTILSYTGSVMLSLSVVLGLVQIAFRIAFPYRAASGITTVILIVLFFGALNLFSVALVGEYIGRIFEEVKQRPHFIRRHFIRDGEIRLTSVSEISRED